MFHHWAMSAAALDSTFDCTRRATERKSRNQACLTEHVPFREHWSMFRPHAGGCAAGRVLLVTSVLVSASHLWAFLTLLPSGVVLVLCPNAAVPVSAFARFGLPGLPIFPGFLPFPPCSLAYLNRYLFCAMEGTVGYQHISAFILLHS